MITNIFFTGDKRASIPVTTRSIINGINPAYRFPDVDEPTLASIIDFLQSFHYIIVSDNELRDSDQYRANRMIQIQYICIRAFLKYPLITAPF